MCNPPCRDLISTGSKIIKGSVLVDLSTDLTNWVFVYLCSVLGAHLIFLALRVWVLMFCVVLVRLTVACVFRLALGLIETPETVRDVVMTCVVLHNILRSQYQGQHGGQEPGDDDDDDDVPGDCRLIGGAGGGGQDRNPAREAKRQRDYLRDNFNNDGAVAYQDGRI